MPQWWPDDGFQRPAFQFRVSSWPVPDSRPGATRPRIHRHVPLPNEHPDTFTVAVTPSYLAHVVEQLNRVVDAVRSRQMFGEAGIYSGEAFFALVADDVLYFKVDDASRPDFEARGMPPFRPYGEDGAAMPYFQVPEEILEDREALRTWAERAIAIARRKKRRPAPRRGA